MIELGGDFISVRGVGRGIMNGALLIDVDDAKMTGIDVKGAVEIEFELVESLVIFWP